MNKAETASQLEAVLKAVASLPDGGTLIDIAIQLSPPVAQRNLQRWLGMLIVQKKIVRVGLSTASRYKLRDGTESDVIPAVSPIGQSIWRLVNQPIAERSPSDYHRVWLDSYRPNQTCWIPEPARTRLRTVVATPTGDGAVQPWSDPAILNRIVADVAWQSGWLEAQDSETPLMSFTMNDVVAWLAQPESPNARTEVQLIWNQRAALNSLLSRVPNVTLSYDVLTAVYTALSRKLVRPNVVLVRGRPTALAPTSTLLRTDSVVLPGTVYRPPAEPWVIETCFNQVLGWAPAIADPIEQAFFVFVHLLYLQPFALLNASMACLAVNIPLLRAGLCPLTFAGVRGADLLDGLRGVWELNRTELLRDVFVQACDDCRERYGP